ncbi:hypothetical protein [Pelagibius marinus]|uniref:hypothetical protein n=1 Tax=Pelagibius marinus TaxID=2762760 RepID=UPI001872F12C|nr:hypothetical protein [Pelagibius marinus]
MSRWNDTSDSFDSGRKAGGNSRDFDRWVERTRSYLKSRTADHWLMFAGGLLIGALLG